MTDGQTKATQGQGRGVLAVPYSKFTPTSSGTVRVSKRGGGGFTSHSASVAKAHRTAALRELAAHGKLRVARQRGK